MAVLTSPSFDRSETVSFKCSSSDIRSGLPPKEGKEEEGEVKEEEKK